MREFKEFRLDPVNHLLWRNADRVPIAPKAFDILAYLVERPGQLVTQDEILDALWRDTFVNPEVLRKYILEIRRVLGDQPNKPEFIETLPKRGYRFIAPVVDEDTDQTTASVTTAVQQQILVTEGRSGNEGTPLPPPTPSFNRIQRTLAAVAAVATVIAAIIGAGADHLHPSQKSMRFVVLSHTSIAVLPFADMSSTKDQEYFSDGLSEQLIDDLAKVPGLRVVGRSSSFQFKGRNEDLREIGRKLGVANILEGSVRREGDHLRISAELIKADDGFQLWAQTYDRQVNDIFAVQDEISSATSRTLQVKLLSSFQPIASTAHAVNPEAYEAYLEARYFSGRGQHDYLDKALAYANTSIKLDPEYAQAWALRASIENMMATLVLVDPTEGFRKARNDAEKAIALDPGTASAYTALATTQMYYDWNWDAASACLDRASALEPGSADILRIRAHLSMILGDLPESIKLDEEAISGDPLRANSYLMFGQLLFSARRYDDATRAFQKALELNLQVTYAHFALGEILLAKKMPHQALAEVGKEPTDLGKLIGEAMVYQDLGRQRDSDAALTELVAKHASDAAYQIAEVYAYRGDSSKSLEWLERAYKQRDSGLSGLKIDPFLKTVRQDQRYTQLLRMLHLPA